MKFDRQISRVVVLFSFVGISGFAFAAAHNPSVENTAVTTPAAIKLTAGEVRKVDLAQGKLTIKHEALENLDMPGMTMVFKTNQADLLNGVKQGDKILFRAEKIDSSFMVVRLVKVQ